MAAGGYGIPPPNPLQLDDANAASNWRTWKTAWENYELATGGAAKEENIRIATLRAVIGEKANKVFETFVFTDNEDKKKIKPVMHLARNATTAVCRTTLPRSAANLHGKFTTHKQKTTVTFTTCIICMAARMRRLRSWSTRRRT